MPTYNVTQFYFGTFADLDPVETSASSLNNTKNENAKVPGWDKGSTFDYNNMSIVQVTENDVVRGGVSDRLEENDYANRPTSQGGPIAADSFTYNLGGGDITSKIDSTFIWPVTITLKDGSTTQQNMTFVQLENGAIFSNTAAPYLAGQKVASITLGKLPLKADGTPTDAYSQYYGTGANRSLPSTTSIVCFAEDVAIRVPGGERPAGALRVGDVVETVDHGRKPVQWFDSRRLDAATLAEAPHLRPIRIAAGALGRGLPQREMLVSPQHRVLVHSRIAQRMFCVEEVLVAAKNLLALPGIAVADDVDEVVYVHFAFDQHEIVYAEGAPAESFYPGPMALRSVDAAAQRELEAIFPSIRDRRAEPARRMLSGREGRALAGRHLKNERELLS
ncbi:Hint domain-containing protein [Paracoccus pacificus]|uniref:Hint domain-containing protein n=1 Tax=Paracoccus pacificus TaxID=1463598 RepID=A0ABW4R7Z2_9RHOB